MSTGTEQTIQLPPDSIAGKNLLRAFSVQVGENTTLAQVMVLADADGNVISTLRSGGELELLAEIRDRLDILIDTTRRRL